MEAGTFFKTVLRAGRDLVRPDILFQALWPPAAAFLLWSIVAWFAWQPMAGWVMANLPDWQWLNWLGPWLAHVAVFFVFAPLVYFTTLLFVAVFALPKMMALIAARDYPDVSRQGSASAAFWGSLANTVVAGLIFVVGWLITLPLLLVPGGLLILPLFWAAWLNQRAFRFDALAEHARVDERDAIVRREGGSLYLAGLIGALVAYVPVLHLLALPYTAVLFVHLCLGALRALRQEQGVTV
ncbi:MAG: EI24 domain-containing protein [Rhodocyclaceae bacterium]|nr:EI24 domain-containing protein [Rhodocyclaceae bacterium]